MRKQLRVFDQPFRKTYRHRRSPHPLQISEAKRRRTKQEFRHRKTARLRDDLEMEREAIVWSPEQLARIWNNTAG